MFKCQQCGLNTEAGEKEHKKVIETRQKKYFNGGSGWEIVKEITVCKACK